MTTDATRSSLLRRVRDPLAADAWREFDRRYGDLIVRYACRCGLQLSDAEDVRQIVLMSLARSLPAFHYERRRGRFRTYLGRVVQHAVARFASPEARECSLIDALRLGELADGPNDNADDRWEDEWVQHHCRKALRSLRTNLDAQSIAVFGRLLAGASIGDVAAAFAMSAEAVRKVKQRVRSRLTELIAAQLREEEQPRG